MQIGIFFWVDGHLLFVEKLILAILSPARKCLITYDTKHHKSMKEGSCLEQTQIQSREQSEIYQQALRNRQRERE